MTKSKVFLTSVLLAAAVLTTPIGCFAADNRWGVELDDSEKTMLAQLVKHEAGNQTKEEQYKVVAVVFNRMNDGRFGGDSVADIVLAPGQFVGANTLYRIPVEEDHLDTVEDVLDGTSSDITDDFDCLYFWGDGYVNHFYK